MSFDKSLFELHIKWPKRFSLYENGCDEVNIFEEVDSSQMGHTALSDELVAIENLILPKELFKRL